MKMLRLIEHVSCRPWAIRYDYAAHVRGLVAKEGIAGLRHLATLKQGVHAWDDDDDDGPRAARSSTRMVSTVAVVPVIGTITQRGDYVNSAYTRSAAGIASEVRAAVTDPSVDAVVLEVDSPGGSVFGVPEAWAAIKEARKTKPIVASANSQAASAAYYLASAADEIIVTPSGEVGSIGVYMLHVDASKALEQMGEKWTFISAGKYKVEGNPAEPLGAEAQAALQTDVNRYYDMFTWDVSKGRGVNVEKVRKGFGEGRMLGAEAAVKEGMANAVGTFDEAVRRAAQLGRERRRSSGAAASAVALEQLGDL
jgi:capsid assembly protease